MLSIISAFWHLFMIDKLFTAFSGKKLGFFACTKLLNESKKHRQKQSLSNSKLEIGCEIFFFLGPEKKER